MYIFSLCFHSFWMLSSFESRGSALRSQGEFWRKQTWLSLTSSSVFLFSFGFECLSFCRMYFYSQPCHEVRLFQIAGSCRNFPRDGRSTHYLHAQIGLTIYAWACVCVCTRLWVRGRVSICVWRRRWRRACLCTARPSIKETDGVVKRAGEMKSGLSNVFSHPFPNCCMLWCLTPQQKK